MKKTGQPIVEFEMRIKSLFLFIGIGFTSDFCFRANYKSPMEKFEGTIQDFGAATNGP